MIQIPVLETTLAELKIGNICFISTPCRSQMCVVRNALTGFRSGWRLQLKVPSTIDVNSETEQAQVNQFDYAVDDSEDDTKEATSTSMSIRKPTKDNKPSKVSSTEFYCNQ